MNFTPTLVHVPSSWRYRCHGNGPSSQAPCPRPAEYWAPDAARLDAATFFCSEHRPENAREITREGEYLELSLSGHIVIAGSTLERSAAHLEALCAIREQLAAIGAAFEPVHVAGCLRRPYPILGPKRHPDAPGAARSDDRAGGDR